MSFFPYPFPLPVTPDMLRLLIVPIFIFAAVLDYKKRVVYNQLWIPAIGLLIIILLWDFLILLTESESALTTYLQSFSISVILGSSIAHMLYTSGNIGGADMKGIIYLSFLFPKPPSITLADYTFPSTPGTTPIFSLTVLLNAIVISTSFRTYILYQNMNNSDTKSLNSKTYEVATEILSEKHGFFKTDNGKEIRIENIRTYITDDSNKQNTQSSKPTKHSTIITTIINSTVPNKIQNLITRKYNKINHPSINSPPLNHNDTKNPNKNKTLTEDQKQAIKHVKQNDYINYSPAIPFFIPLTIGLIIAIVHGSILYTVIKTIILLLI